MSENNTFNEILTKEGNVFFVDELWVKSLAEAQWTKTLDLHRNLELASAEGKESFFSVDVNELTGERLIQHLFSKSGSSNSIDTSDPFALIDVFSKLKPGVVVFYNTHLISSDVLRLVSKLISHLKQHNSEWKFILYGEANQLAQIAKTRLFIEHYYPKEYKNSLQISKKTTNESLQADSSSNRFGFVKGLFLFFVLAIAGALIYLIVERPFNTSDNPQAINGETVNINSTIENEPSQLQDDLQPSQTLAEMVRESKLQELEFEEKISEINATIQTETEETESEKAKAETEAETETSPSESSDQKQPIIKENKKNRSSVNKTRLLSNEVEQAVLNNDLNFLKSFSDKSMLIRGKNSKGETALIISINNKREQIVNWLLQQNALVDSRDNYGRTALFYSAVQGNENFISQLMQAGAQVSLGSKLSKTPLMAAVHNNHYESARLLLASRKTKVDTQDHSGWSALFYAVWNSNSQMANLLLEFGASTSLIDNSGLNINQVADEAGFSEWRNINRNQ